LDTIEDYETWETNITSSDQSGWVFGEGQTKGDLVNDRNHYIWFGAFSWVRSLTLLGAFGFLPTAMAQARLNRYNIAAAPKFMWLAKWWSHIAGLMSTFINLTLAGFMISGMWRGNVEECSSSGSGSGYSLAADCEFWSN